MAIFKWPRSTQGSIGSGSGLGSGQLSAKSLEGQGLFLNLATTAGGHGEIPGNPERMEAIEAISWEYLGRIQDDSWEV
jgi:hypothetical protein